MKIGYLVSQYPAPSHTFVRREIHALRRRGLPIETFSIRPAECLSDVDRQEQANTFYVLPAPFLGLIACLLRAAFTRPGAFFSTLAATARHRLPGLRSLIWSVFYFIEAIRLAEVVKARGVTHLHNHFANPAAHVGMAVARFLGIGWSLSLHGLGDFEGPMLPLLSAKIDAARFVISVTEYGKREIERLIGKQQKGRIWIARCGIELSAMPPARERRPRASGERVKILCVGRLSPEKAQAGLIEAFALATERGLDAELTLIGGGPDEAKLMAEVQRRGLEHRITLRGPLPEAQVLEAMTQADMLVLSSLVEGLPVVLMEALALGCPVIAPAITGIPELVIDGETGLLFGATHWNELAAAMQKLAADPELGARLAAAGRARVLEHFDVDRSVVPLFERFTAG